MGPEVLGTAVAAPSNLDLLLLSSSSKISQSTLMLNRYVVDLHAQAAPLTQDIISRFSQKTEQLKTQVETELEAMTINLQPYSDMLVPYTEEMKQKIEQNLEDFQTSMTSITENLASALNQKSQEVQQSLVPLGEELIATLDTSVEDLQVQLTALWEAITKSQ